ncbi:hypothetical protein L218DRAFT_1007192 [Marasmius fiardii PR-910]|nr:hypothetical protein L218DRAFT_1007192 [Marasmius fiardii PR-910]
MRPTSLKLLQILPRTALDKKAQATLIPSLPELVRAATASKSESRTVVDELLSRKKSQVTSTSTSRTSGHENWPSNLRVEPVVKKEHLKHVHADVRKRMKELIMKET